MKECFSSHPDQECMHHWKYPPPILAIASCNRREPTETLRNYMWRELKNQSNLKFSLLEVHTRDNAHSLKSTETLKKKGWIDKIR
jgi:hypothetical protein